MSELSDRVIMVIMILGIATPLLGWVAGSYIGLMPPWYSEVVLPAVFALAMIVLAIVAWTWLDRVE